MSQEPPVWIVIQCPSCAARLKAPQAVEHRGLQCPRCHAVIPPFAAPGEPNDDAGAAGTTGPQFVRALPSRRNLESQSFRVRGREKEEWEQDRTAPKKPSPELRVARIGDDVPRLGQVRKRKRSRRSKSGSPEWDSTSGGPRRHTSRRIRRILWVAVGVSLLSAILVGIRALQTAGFKSAAPAPTPLEPEFGVPTLAGNGAAGRNFPTVDNDDYAAVERVLGQFCSARSPAEMLPFVRDIPRVRPIINAYYRENPFQRVTVKKLPNRGDVVAYQNILLGILTLDNLDRRLFGVEKTPEGYFIDWESFVGWCEVPWEKLGSIRPLEPVVLRARINDDDYFNHDYADSKRYGCFRLSSFDGAHVVYGYVERRRLLFADLESRAKLNQLVLATLKIRFPSAFGPPNQVEITELVEDGWILKSERSKVAGTPRF